MAANLIPARAFDEVMEQCEVADGRSQFFSAVTWILIHIDTQRVRISPLEILKLRFEEVVDDNET